MSRLISVKKKRILYFFLSIVMMASLLGSNTVISHADVTEESIKAKEQQISNAKKERDSLKKTKTDLEKVKKDLESSKSNLNSYIAKIDASLTDVQENIDSLDEQITIKEGQIETTTQELAEAEQVQMNQYEAMRTRIKFMYERSGSIYLELLMKSGSFAEMLNKADYIESLSAYDRAKLEEYKETTQLIALTKEALEEEKTTLDEAKEAKEA